MTESHSSSVMLTQHAIAQVAGVAHERVEAAERVDRGLHHRLGATPRSDVVGAHRRRAARRRRSRRRRFAQPRDRRRSPRRSRPRRRKPVRAIGRCRARRRSRSRYVHHRFPLALLLSAKSSGSLRRSRRTCASHTRQRLARCGAARANQAGIVGERLTADRLGQHVDLLPPSPTGPPGPSPARRIRPRSRRRGCA